MKIELIIMDSKEDITIEIQIRTALLNFYASQLGGHSRFIIGFSVVLFSVITVRTNLLSTFPDLDFLVIYSSLFIASSVFCFLIMRYLVYGILSNSATHAPIKISDDNTFAKNRTEINNHAINSRILGIFHISWFLSIGKKESWIRKERLYGIFLCLGIGFSITFLISLLPLKTIF